MVTIDQDPLYDVLKQLGKATAATKTPEKSKIHRKPKQKMPSIIEIQSMAVLPLNKWLPAPWKSWLTPKAHWLCLQSILSKTCFSRSKKPQSSSFNPQIFPIISRPRYLRKHHWKNPTTTTGVLGSCTGNNQTDNRGTALWFAPPANTCTLKMHQSAHFCHLTELHKGRKYPEEATKFYFPFRCLFNPFNAVAHHTDLSYIASPTKEPHNDRGGKGLLEII